MGELWLWPQLDLCSTYAPLNSLTVSKLSKKTINHHYFNFLFEPYSPKKSLICFYLFGLIKKIMEELIFSASSLITNLLRRDLAPLRENCPNTEFSLERKQRKTDQKKLRI